MHNRPYREYRALVARAGRRPDPTGALFAAVCALERHGATVRGCCEGPRRTTNHNTE